MKAALSPQLPADGSVELIIKEELPAKDGGPTIGANRNEILELATGEYIDYVDDDDNVTNDFVERILKAIESRPDVVGIKGHYILGNNKPELFIHSIAYTEWFTKDGIHYRCPNHLNPVKRELALKAKFTEKNFGEDQDYSLALRPFLKTEVMIEKVIYMYLK
ncbi:MAG: hypothetical protein A2173_03825 [Planctomycetes bacterium RBG_13_44_8b]|nr:MAG: hypothetical protein A2173_03825 [Planctomycetes bacterium RBG_13_44_8b]